MVLGNLSFGATSHHSRPSSVTMTFGARRLAEFRFFKALSANQIIAFGEGTDFSRFTLRSA
jgi:hypothetical protein